MDDKKQENNIQRDPAPVKTEKNKKRWLYSLVGGAIALTSFFAGFGAHWFTLDKEMRTLINVKKKIDREYYEEISDDKFYGAVFDAVNNQVLDRYSRYIPSERYSEEKASNAGKRNGLGLVFHGTAAPQEAQTIVCRVCGNSPAERAGFRVGDRLTGFGMTQDNMTDCSAFDAFSNFIGERGNGEQFFVRVDRAGDSLVLPVACQPYVESYVFYKSNTSAYTIAGDDEDEVLKVGEPLACLDNDTAYMRLIQFAGDAADLFEEGLKLLKKEGKKNLVLDLRGNGGGDLAILQEIASWLCKDATGRRPTVVLADYGEKKEYFRADDNEYDKYFSAESRICVLADNGTASASEALMGAMLDYNTVGYADICLIAENGVAKTYGKGIMQTTYIMDLIEQDALRLTTAKILWPKSKNCIHDRGILLQDGTKTAVKNYNADEELTAAIKALFA